MYGSFRVEKRHGGKKKIWFACIKADIVVVSSGGFKKYGRRWKKSWVKSI